MFLLGFCIRVWYIIFVDVLKLDSKELERVC